MNWRSVQAAGQNFSQAWNLKTPWPASAYPWDFRLVGKPALRMQRGDRLVARFWMRTISAEYGEGYTRFVVERSRDPYPKSAEFAISAGKEWKRFDIPFVAVETDEPDGYTVQFWISSGPQEIEIGGFQLTNYGPDAAWETLGLPNYPYEGSSPQASWRAEAAARIEQYRKGEIVVVARDAAGKAIPNAGVTIRMKRHEFSFGSAVDGFTLLENSGDAEKYRQTFLNNFTRATLENDLKWQSWIQTRGRALEALEWLKRNGIRDVRGHTLIWPDWKYLPPDLKNLADNPEQLRGRIDQHLRDIVPATKGLVREWDVLNEPVSNRTLQRLLGDAELGRWFRMARAGDPQAKLYVNDFNILEAGGNDTPQQAGLLQIVQMLDKQAAGVEGIGLQAHFSQDLTPPAKLYSILDRYAALGKELQVTEFDVDVPNEELQAAYLRDFLTVVFSHPKVSGLTLWGFWEGRHWKPSAALFRRDFSLKPAGEAWRDLVFEQWWSNGAGVTGDDGVYRMRGFAGEYEAEISVNGQTQVYPFTVTANRQNYVFIGQRLAPAISSAGVVNAASFRGGPVAPGEVVTLFGEGFGYTRVAQASYNLEGALQTVAGDVRVLFDGRPAPMVYSTQNQVSAIVPSTVAGLTRLQVEFQGMVGNVVTLPVAEAAPGIFTRAGGAGQVAALNNDEARSWNEPATPVARGGVLTFFLTGAGAVSPTLSDGELPKAGYPSVTLPLEVAIGGVPARVEFAGLVYPGVIQVNVRVPEQAPTGSAVDLVARFAHFSSQPGVTLAIR